MAQAIELAVDPAQGRAAPGESRVLTLTLINHSRVPHRIQLDVSGIPRASYHLAATSVALEPGAERTASLTLQPTDSPALAVGRYPFRVQATAQDDPTVYASAVIDLTIGAGGALHLEIQPSEIVGSQGTFKVAVVNDMPWPATALLMVRDDAEEGALRTRLEPAGPMVVPAGDRRTATLRVAARAGSAAQVFDVMVLGVQPGRGLAPTENLTRHVRFRYTPRVGGAGVLPVWRLPRWALLAPLLLLLALAVAAVAGQNGKPAVVPPAPPRATATAALEPTATLPPSPSPTRPAPIHRVQGVTVQAPAIRQFVLRHGTSGAPYRLIWRTHGAARVTLDGQFVARQGRLVLHPPLHTTTYRLVAITGRHTVADSIRIVVGSGATPGPHTFVLALPNIVTLMLQHRAGGTDVVWRVQGARTVLLQGRPAPDAGRRPIPRGVMQVTLIARNDVGSRERRLRIPATATATPSATSTPTAVSTPTQTARPTATATITAPPTATRTPRPTLTATQTPLPTPTTTWTAVPTPTATATPTVALIPIATATPTAPPTATRTPLRSIPVPILPGTPLSTQAVVLLNPTTLQFGTQALATASAIHTVHVVNLGPGALSVTGITISGPAAADFSVQDTCHGGPIPVDQGCAIAVRFTPHAAGVRRADLLVTDSAPHGPQTVALQGRA